MADPTNYDDPTIPDESELWRRIHPRWVVPDGNAGGVRVTSAAFDDSPGGSAMSVLIAEKMAASGRSPQDAVVGLEGYSLVGIMARNVRAHGLGVTHTPTPDEPAHGSVNGKKTRSIRRALAKSARWLVQAQSKAESDE